MWNTYNDREVKRKIGIIFFFCPSCAETKGEGFGACPGSVRGNSGQSSDWIHWASFSHQVLIKWKNSPETAIQVRGMQRGQSHTLVRKIILPHAWLFFCVICVRAQRMGDSKVFKERASLLEWVIKTQQKHKWKSSFTVQLPVEIITDVTESFLRKDSSLCVLSQLQSQDLKIWSKKSAIQLVTWLIIKSLLQYKSNKN